MRTGDLVVQLEYAEYLGIRGVAGELEAEN